MKKELKNLNVIFMGTPEYSLPVLDMLIKNTNVILVVSQPDKEVGRKRELTATPTKKLAESFGIDVFQPTKIRKDFDPVVSLKPDIIITCAYGQIIPKEILECARLGCINVHASLLPHLRGGAPIHKAIIDGYDSTGITIMYMDETMDTGDIISQREYIIQDSDDTEVLHNIMSVMGAELLFENLPSIVDGTNPRIKQDHSKATFAYNIKREEETIDFNKSVRDVFNQIRGLSTWPMANTLINGVEFKILESTYKECQVKSPGVIVEVTKNTLGITANNGIIYVTKIKPFGKKIMPIKDYLNGIKPDDLLNKKVGE